MQHAPRSPARARAHRQTMTPSEVALWRVLRANRFKGLRFRRQHPFGPYILDFYCDRAKLAVEVDGGVHQHEAQMMQDAARDAWVAQHGVRTLRLPARLVLENIDAALGLISAELGWRGPGYPFG
ncbi:MAG: DUF559 domain-containing protein [Caulobacter sp.]|nr:DUF559 domain-containing protein [Caulobacter sp.]